MEKYIEDLKRLCSEILGRGGITRVEKRFHFVFREWKRSSRGPYLDKVLHVLEFLNVGPDEFFESKVSVEQAPSWWEEFRFLRHDSPLLALDTIKGKPGPWFGYARGAIALQWGLYRHAIRESRQVPDSLRFHRRMSLALATTDGARAMHHSRKAAGLAAFKIDSDELVKVLVERGLILSVIAPTCADLPVLLNRSLENARYSGLRASASQQLANWYIGQNNMEMAKEHLAAARRFHTDRHLLGHVKWTEARLEKSVPLLVEALRAFGAGFPREVALITNEIRKIDRNNPAIEEGISMLRCNSQHHLAMAIEESMMVGHSRKSLEEIWRTRASRVLQNSMAA